MYTETEPYDEVDPHKLEKKYFPLEVYVVSRLLLNGFTILCRNGFKVTPTVKQLSNHVETIKPLYLWK